MMLLYIMYISRPHSLSNDVINGCCIQSLQTLKNVEPQRNSPSVRAATPPDQPPQRTRTRTAARPGQASPGGLPWRHRPRQAFTVINRGWQTTSHASLV